MQSTESIADYHHMLENPVHFKLSVAKRLVDAQFVSATFQAGLGYKLKIIFNDGHEDEYELCEFGIYTASGKVDQYCKALQKEIYEPLGGWTSGTKVFVINFQVNGKNTNIWISGNEEQQYSVYYSNEFRFFIKKEQGQWYTNVPEAYGEIEIDKELLNKVIKALNYYTT